MKPELISLEQDSSHNIYEIYNNFKAEEPFYSGACLAGLDTPEAWEIRLYLLGHSKDGRRGVAQGLAGIRTEKAYELRVNLLEDAPESVARSLAGDDSEIAWQLRQKIKERLDEAGVANGLAESIANIDTPRAWELRNELLKDRQAISSILEGLAGVNSEAAWKIRADYVNEYPAFVAGSLIGLSGQRVEAMRKQIASLDEQAVLMSYTGSNEPKAWELRDKFLNINPFFVGTSLAGIDNKKANETRERLINMLTLNTGEAYNKVRKGILQGLHSNYIFESLKTAA